MPPLPWPILACLIATVVLAGVADARTGRVPNVITYPAALLGPTLHWLHGGAEAAGLSGAGMLVLLLPSALVMNGGDAKLLGAIGAYAAWPAALPAAFAAFAVAAAWAVILAIVRRRPVLGPVLGALPALLSGRWVDPTSRDSPCVPFAVCAAIGTLGWIAFAWVPAAAG